MTAIRPSLQKFARSSNSALPAHLGTRYNTDGIFLVEPGNTVVSHVVAGSLSQAAILTVRERLMAMPESSLFAFTDASSLHMTIFQGVIEYRRRFPFWPQDVPFDTQIETMTELYLERLKGFTAPPAFNARITDVTPLGLRLEGDTEADRDVLKQWRDGFADVLGYRHPDHETYVFHITFAYIIDWLPDEVLARWSDVLAEQLAFLQAQSPVFELRAPAFCSFQDMNHFEELLIFDPQ